MSGIYLGVIASFPGAQITKRQGMRLIVGFGEDQDHRIAYHTVISICPHETTCSMARNIL